MAAKKKTDWEAIHTAYLAERATHNEVDVKALADRFKVNYGTLRNRISENGWAQEGREMHAEATKQVRAKIVPEIVDKRVQTIKEHLEYTTFIKKKAMQTLVDPEATLTPALAAKMVFDAMQKEDQLLTSLALAAPAEVANPREELMARFNRFAKSLGLDVAEDEVATA